MPGINPNQLGAFQFPGGGLLNDGPPAFEMPSQPANMASLYGLLAQYADNPAEIGKDYAVRMQQQQQLNAQQSPYMQMLKIYGNVNPHDFEADSIMEFHKELVKGQFRPDLLVRYNPYSSTEQQSVADASKQAFDSERQLWEMQSIAEGFERAAARGELAGAPAVIENFFRNTFGKQNEMSMLRTRFNRTVNESVINSLPPGVASDRDIALAREGWPTGYYDPARIAAYLRVMRGVEGYRYAQNLYRARAIGTYKDESRVMDMWNKDKDMFTRQVFQDMNIPLYDRPGNAPPNNLYPLAPGTGTGTPATEDQLRERYGLPARP